MTIKAYIAFSKILFAFLVFFLASAGGDSFAQNNDSTKTKYLYFINSTPFNAEVHYRDSLLGLTPVRFVTEEKLTGKIFLKKQGYENSEFDLSGYNFESGTNVFLKSLTVQEEKIILKDSRTGFVKKRDLPGILVSGLLAVTGGALAYNNKEKANDFYSQYISYGDRNNLDKSRRYDIYYGLSLALMQVSVGGLIYFLFLE